MNGDVSHLALIVGMTVAVNAVSAQNRGKEPIVAVVGGGLSFVGLAVFGGLTGYMELATAVAYVFLISAIVFRGLPLIQTFSKLANQKG